MTTYRGYLIMRNKLGWYTYIGGQYCEFTTLDRVQEYINNYLLKTFNK